MLFHPLVVPKAPNLKMLWLFEHMPMMGEMEDFSYFGKKSSTVIKEKSSIPPIMGMCLNNHNSFKFGAFGTTKWWKSILNNVIQTFHFFDNFVVCLFPTTNIRDFTQKRVDCFWKNEVETMENRPNPNHF